MTVLPLATRRAPTSSIRAASTTEGPDVIPLALGRPSWPLPGAAKRALAIVDSCGYGSHAGESMLRRTIADYEGVDEDRIFVTCGAQGALFAVAQTFLGPGDVALVPDPGFPAYPALAEIAGAVAVAYTQAADRRFGLDSEAVLNTLEHTPRAKVVFINSPANPTGGGASALDLRRIAEACARRGVLLVADEVYRELHLGGPPPSLLSITDTGLVVGSVSKAWGAPGLRVGWLAGNPTLLDPIRALHAAMVTSAAGPSQAAAHALIEARSRVLPAARRALRRRWMALAESWLEVTGNVPEPPEGGIYHWFRVDNDDRSFCRRARDVAGVALVPGSVFGREGRGRARLCFGAEPRTIRLGVRRLKPLLAAP